MQWKDIDFENKTISISRSLLPSKKGLIFHEPKTENSTRVLKLPQTILDELQKHKEQQDIIKSIAGNAYQDNDLVTCRQDGSPINPGSFSHTFARVLKRKNLQHIRFHDLRHPYVKHTPKNILSFLMSTFLKHTDILPALKTGGVVIIQTTVRVKSKVVISFFIGVSAQVFFLRFQRQLVYITHATVNSHL